MKLPSKAQLWARERNWNKARLTSVICTLRNMSKQSSTTASEKLEFESSARLLSENLSGWDKSNKVSKFKYLKD